MQYLKDICPMATIKADVCFRSNPIQNDHFQIIWSTGNQWTYHSKIFTDQVHNKYKYKPQNFHRIWQDTRTDLKRRKYMCIVVFLFYF